jgi:hypothetical protein
LAEDEIETPLKRDIPFEKGSHFFPAFPAEQLVVAKSQQVLSVPVTAPAVNATLVAQHNNQEDSMLEARGHFDYIKDKEEYPSDFKDMKQCKNMEIESAAYLKTEEIQILMHNLPRDHDFNKFGEKAEEGIGKRVMSNLIVEAQACDSVIYENCAV